MTYQCPVCQRSFAEPGFCPFDGKPLQSTSIASQPTVVDDKPTDTKPGVGESNKLLAVSAHEGHAEALSKIKKKVSEYDRLIGETLDGRYFVQKKIGEGGMGVVFAVKHAVIERPLAIKVLKREALRDSATIQRFIQEAKAASRIGHPNIVDVTDFGKTPDGMTYSVMEYVDGTTLSKVIKSAAPLPAERAVRIASQIARALAAAHGKGIVHRDLKPDNVFIVNDPEVPGGERIKLLDFGIAKLANDDTNDHRTRTGAVIGTPKYMAPEQCRGVPVDHRADLYSLGVMMFVLGTGRAPFVGEGSGDVLAAHIHVPPPLMSSLVQGVPPAIEELVQRLLMKAPSDRLQSAEDIIRTIDAITVQGTNPSVTPLPAMSLPAMPSLPPFVTESPTKPTTLSGAAFDKPATAPGAGRQRTVLVAVLAAAAVGGVAIALSLQGSQPRAAKPYVSSASPPAAPSPEPEPAAAAPEPAVAEPVPAAPPSVTPPAATDPASATVELSIDSTPSGAIILRDGAQLGVTPFHGTLPKTDAPVKLTLRKSGYKDKIVTVVPVAALDQNIKLESRPHSTTHSNRDQSVNPF
jgi:serine/threonine-protein kinase